MRRRSPYLLPLAALLGAAAPLAAQKDAAPDTVQLRFGWTPGMSGTLAWEQVRIRRTPERTDSVRMASETAFRVEPHPEGLQIRWGHTRWTDVPRMEGPLGAVFEGFSRLGASGKPAYVIADSGDASVQQLDVTAYRYGWAN